MAGLRWLRIPWGAADSQPHTDINAPIPTALADYYAAPGDGDTAGTLVALQLVDDGAGAYYYSGQLRTTDGLTQLVEGIVNAAGIFEILRVYGVSTGTPYINYKDAGLVLGVQTRSLRTGFTRHAASTADVTTTAVLGQETALLTLNPPPMVRAGWVYAVTIGGRALCAVAASSIRLRLRETYVSTAAVGIDRGVIATTAANPTAGRQVSFSGRIYLKNTSATDYAMAGNLTLTGSPDTANAWTAVHGLPPFWMNIERVGRVEDADGWPEALAVA